MTMTAVTEGEYSDYWVLFLCTTREEAEACMAEDGFTPGRWSDLDPINRSEEEIWLHPNTKAYWHGPPGSPCPNMRRIEEFEVRFPL